MLKISVSICITLIVFVKYLNMSRADSQNKNKGLSRLDGRHEWVPQVADNTDSASTPKRTHSQTSTSSTPQQPSKRVNIDNDSTDELLEFSTISHHFILILTLMLIKSVLIFLSPLLPWQ